MSALRMLYQTIDYGLIDIHLRTLKDNQQFEDIDQVAEKLGISSANWPLYGVLWASGQVLSRHMLDFDIVGKRVLEVGCGIGLSSLLLNKRDCDITATDYHPEAGKFLAHNVALNNDKAIPFKRLDWADMNNDLGKFDLIIGSDLLYEQEHIELLSKFINR
jgi:ETFB lysine methyltransferase